MVITCSIFNDNVTDHLYIISNLAFHYDSSISFALCYSANGQFSCYSYAHLPYCFTSDYTPFFADFFRTLRTFDLCGYICVVFVCCSLLFNIIC